MGARWVVVGAGSAGCVVAARLGEDDDHEVVVVEAGPASWPPAHDEAVRGPDFLAAGMVDGLVHDGLVATRAAGGGRPSRYVRGRGVGGSSLVNAMVALETTADLMPGCTADELAAARRRMAVATEVVGDHELGPLDRALAAAAPDTERAVLTRANGRRHTSADAYLAPVAGRANVHVTADTTVDRVVLDGRRAVGVVTAAGDRIDADHVVVAAGAIHTPAILLRSGIDIPAVGAGLQDHPSVTFTLRLRPEVPSSDGPVIGSLLRRGPVQVLPMNRLGAGAASFGALLVAHMAPRGRAGRVALASTDPDEQPRVDLALLDDPHDRRAMLDAARFGIELVRTPPFTEIAEEVFVDAAGTPLSALHDDDAVERWVATAVGDYVHATGTCAMGTVVDRDGAVIGYDRLRVCDASVFPQIPDVNTHLPTTLLAEVMVARWRG